MEGSTKSLGFGFYMNISASDSYFSVHVSLFKSCGVDIAEKERKVINSLCIKIREKSRTKNTADTQMMFKMNLKNRNIDIPVPSQMTIIIYQEKGTYFLQYIDIFVGSSLTSAPKL